MSWTDKQAVKDITQLRDEFGIKFMVETGTFRGINAQKYSTIFDYIMTCEINDEYLRAANKRIENILNVYTFKNDSSNFLKNIADTRKDSKETCLFYLDAHFYDPTLPKDKRFVVLDELRALKGFNNGVIVVHDFDNGQLGHITYDGIPLDLNLMREGLKGVNPNFKFYTNKRCDVYNKETILTDRDITVDEDVQGNIAYANTSPEKRDRGILYCSPRELDLTKFDNFREIK